MNETTTMKPTSLKTLNVAVAVTLGGLAQNVGVEQPAHSLRFFGSRRLRCGKSSMGTGQAFSTSSQSGFFATRRKGDDIIFGIEAGVELVTGRGRRERGRNAHAALIIKRYNHGGIFPLRRRGRQLTLAVSLTQRAMSRAASRIPRSLPVGKR